MKVGGFNSRMMGFAWTSRGHPITSEEIATDCRDVIRSCIDIFGPERSMLESNFPIDRDVIGPDVLWNAFKLMTADMNDTERQMVFHDAAVSAYRLGSAAGSR